MPNYRQERVTATLPQAKVDTQIDLWRNVLTNLRNVLTKAVSGTTMLYSSRPSPSLSCHNFMLRPYKFWLRQSSSGERKNGVEVSRRVSLWDPRTVFEYQKYVFDSLLACARKFFSQKARPLIKMQTFSIPNLSGVYLK